MYTGVYDILLINHIYFKKNMTKYKINPSKIEQSEVLQEGKLMINYCYIYGDSDEKSLYLDISDKIKVDYCAAQNVAHIVANS